MPFGVKRYRDSEVPLAGPSLQTNWATRDSSRRFAEEFHGESADQYAGGDGLLPLGWHFADGGQEVVGVGLIAAEQPLNGFPPQKFH